jgi:hypothetical protein
MERQTGVREDDFIGVVAVIRPRPVHERLIEWVVFPAAPVIRWIEGRWISRPPLVIEEKP